LIETLLPEAYGLIRVAEANWNPGSGLDNDKLCSHKMTEWQTDAEQPETDRKPYTSILHATKANRHTANRIYARSNSKLPDCRDTCASLILFCYCGRHRACLAWQPY